MHDNPRHAQHINTRNPDVLQSFSSGRHRQSGGNDIIDKNNFFTLQCSDFIGYYFKSTL